jgi:hypothetical protein
MGNVGPVFKKAQYCNAYSYCLRGKSPNYAYASEDIRIAVQNYELNYSNIYRSLIFLSIANIWNDCQMKDKQI